MGSSSRKYVLSVHISRLTRARPSSCIGIGKILARCIQGPSTNPDGSRPFSKCWSDISRCFDANIYLLSSKEPPTKRRRITPGDRNNDVAPIIDAENVEAVWNDADQGRGVERGNPGLYIRHQVNRTYVHSEIEEADFPMLDGAYRSSEVLFHPLFIQRRPLTGILGTWTRPSAFTSVGQRTI